MFTAEGSKLKIWCCVCGYPDAERAHIKTRGAGAGWKDHEWVYLCRKHHSEQHSIGIISFYKKYPTYQKQLEARGWQLQNGKLVHTVTTITESEKQQ